MKTVWLRHALGLYLFLWVIQGYTQTVEHNPNQVYENFAQAYLEMDADGIDRLYTKDAALLNLYDSSNPNSIRGNEEIENFFSGMFARFGKNGQKLELTFKIIDRNRIDDTILDNGFYTLTIHGSDQTKTVSYGKLSAILKLEKEGWKFMIDANSNTDESEYHNAEGNEIPRRN